MFTKILMLPCRFVSKLALSDQSTRPDELTPSVTDDSRRDSGAVMDDGGEMRLREMLHTFSSSS